MLITLRDTILRVGNYFYTADPNCMPEDPEFLDELQVKLMFFKKATKIDQIFTGNLTLCSKCQIDGEDLVNFCDLLRKHELYVRSGSPAHSSAL